MKFFICSSSFYFYIIHLDHLSFPDFKPPEFSSNQTTSEPDNSKEERASIGDKKAK